MQEIRKEEILFLLESKLQRLNEANKSHRQRMKNIRNTIIAINEWDKIGITRSEVKKLLEKVCEHYNLLQDKTIFFGDI
jgi:predicted GTPase